MAADTLESAPVNVRVKLASLWASVMFCYIYADYFGLYIPGALEKMLQGRMGPLGPTTPNILLGTSVLMAIPSCMIFLSIALPARTSRWCNIVFGLLYTLVICLTMWSWSFYVFFGVIEIAMTVTVAVHAWRWPTAKAS